VVNVLASIVSKQFGGVK